MLSHTLGDYKPLRLLAYGLTGSAKKPGVPRMSEAMSVKLPGLGRYEDSSLERFNGGPEDQQRKQEVAKPAPKLPFEGSKVD